MWHGNATFEGQSDLETMALNITRKAISDREANVEDIERATRPMKTAVWALPIFRIAGSTLVGIMYYG